MKRPRLEKTQLPEIKKKTVGILLSLLILCAVASIVMMFAMIFGTDETNYLSNNTKYLFGYFAVIIIAFTVSVVISSILKKAKNETAKIKPEEQLNRMMKEVEQNDETK